MNRKTQNQLPQRELLSVAGRQNRDGCVIVTFANRNFLPVVLNWLIALDRISVENAMVVALDEHTWKFLQKRGFPVVQVDFDKSLKGLRITRVRVSQLLVQN